MDRVARLSHQVSASAASKCSSGKAGDDIVIVSCVRTPIGRARKGSFRNTSATDLLVPVLKHVVESTGVDPKLVGDIVCGTVLAAGSIRATEVRIAGFLAGYPETVPVRTVNRQCSSGLQAIADVAAAIEAGFYDIGVAAGVETMTHQRMAVSKKDMGFMTADNILANENGRNCLLGMGITSENVAERFGVTRRTQDEVAVRSHANAAAATKAGRFKDEIVPVTTTVKDLKTGKETQITVSKDDGIREGTTLESLAKLRTVFKKGGSTTAGNASQVSDGAAACLLMKRSMANTLGVPILAKFKAFSVAGVPPDIMGIGPAAAIPAVCKQAGLNVSDIDLYEINEAFGSQASYCVEHLNIPWDKVNVNGGAIALGHPLGCTGVRMAATLLHEMKRRNDKTGIVSMCIGSGMGAAGIFERD